MKYRFVWIVFLLTVASCACRAPEGPQAVLRISEWRTGRILAQAGVNEGSKLHFGWIHSLEKIPWNEEFIVQGNVLILDAISFPAFGAGIPEDKGRVCFIKDGMIHMQQIDQRFEELVWLNSHTATQAITVDGTLVARGADLPQHTRLRLTIEEK